MIKHILIPEYAPLYAMRKCFGPNHSPLSKPTPVSTEIIYDLMKQTGREAVSIYEVGYDANTRKTYGDPIRLTMANYKTPYDELVNGSSKVETSEVIIVEEVKEKEPEVFIPKVETISEVEPEKEETKAIVEEAKEVDDGLITDLDEVKEKLEEYGKEADAAKATEEKETSEVVEEEAPVTTTTQTTNNNNHHMTKAERRAARKAAMDAKNKEEQN